MTGYFPVVPSLGFGQTQLYFMPTGRNILEQRVRMFWTADGYSKINLNREGSRFTNKGGHNIAVDGLYEYEWYPPGESLLRFKGWLLEDACRAVTFPDERLDATFWKFVSRTLNNYAYPLMDKVWEYTVDMNGYGNACIRVRFEPNKDALKKRIFLVLVANGVFEDGEWWVNEFPTMRSY